MVMVKAMTPSQMIGIPGIEETDYRCLSVKSAWDS